MSTESRVDHRHRVGVDRAVEVLVDRGEQRRPRWTVGSGCVVGGRWVLTAAHIVAGAERVLVRVDGEVEWPAEVLAGGDAERGVDLALVEIADPGFGEASWVWFARVDRDEADLVGECWAVGFPQFKEKPAASASGAWLRDTAHVQGTIPPGANLVSGLLELQVTAAPTPVERGGSPWEGMSGAVVFAAEPHGDRAIGVVVEHHLAEGASSLTVAPATAAEQLATSDEANAWRQLVACVEPAELVCPYPGMRPFTEADQAAFFGRAGEVDELMLRLRAHPRVVLIGASGSGKSSLLHAGLMPSLAGADVAVRDLRPGPTPVQELGKALDGELATDDEAVGEAACRLAEAARAAAGAGRLVVVVDQLEEVFAQADADQRQAFLAALAALPEAAGCQLVAAVRADFYQELMTSPLWPLGEGERLDLAPLAGEALRQAITTPAAQLGVTVEADLVERLVADAADEPGALPLIQETLVVLWERRDRRRLTLQAYHDLGQDGRSGLHVAVATRAGACLNQLTAAQQQLARQVLLRLVQPGEGRSDTRRQQTREQLRPAHSDADDFQTTLARLADNRLVTTDTTPQGTVTVDLAHEALIAGWPRLGRWIDQQRDALRTHRELAGDAEQWHAHGRDPAALYRGARLQAATDFADAHPDALNQLEAEFLHASRNQARRATRRRRAAVAALAGLTVIALIAAGVAFTSQQRAEQEAARAEEEAARADEAAARADEEAEVARAAQAQAEEQASIALSRQLAAQANDTTNPDLALLLGLEAHATADTLPAQGALLSAVQRAPRLGIPLTGHSSRVAAVAFSPDGGRLASAGNDGTVRLWDATTGDALGEPLRGHGPVTAHSGGVNAVAFSPDGGRLASAGGDGTVRLWDATTGDALGEPLRHGPRGGLRGAIVSVAFSSDGDRLASASFDGAVRLWDATTGEPVGEPVTVHSGGTIAVASSPDGELRVASAGGDGAVRLWDATTGEPLGEPLTGHSGDVWSVAISPDGGRLASASREGPVRLWDATSGEPVGEPLTGHSSAVNAVAFSSDGDRLASAGADGTVRLWDATTGDALGEPRTGHVSGVSAVAFSPDGDRLASAGGDATVRLWTATTGDALGEPLAGHSGAVNAVAFSPDGDRLASLGNDGTVRLWNPDTGESVGEPLSGGANAVAFSPDGDRLASGGGDGAVRLWDASTGEPVGEPVTVHSGGTIAVASSADGELRVASVGGDGTVRLWDVETGEPVGEPLTGHSGDILSVAFSPDGGRLASAGADATVRLWDATTGEPVGEPLTGHSGGMEKFVSAVAFSPDGDRLASAGADGTVRLWDATTGEPVGEPLTGHGDATEGRISAVRSVAFSPDGDRLASGGGDGTVRLWDATTGEPVGDPLTGHSGAVLSVAFSSDGGRLASAGDDGTVRLWAGPAQWRDRACELVTRNLTQQEWDRFIGELRDYEKTCPDLPVPGA